jgi:hypothetical protein
VTTETTELPQTEDSLPSISEQLTAMQALAGLAEMFGPLPGAYLIVHAPHSIGFPARITMQLDTPQAFEEWRSVLQIPGNTVDFHSREDSSWMSADTHAHGVPLHITGFGIGLTAEQAGAPRDTNEVAA